MEKHVERTLKEKESGHRHFLRRARDAAMDLMCSRILPSRGQEENLYEWQSTPHLHLPIDSGWEESVCDAFRISNAIVQDAYIRRIQGISVLDGRSGFVASGLRVVRSSLPYDTDALMPDPTLPFRSLLTSARSPVEKALSLRDPYELNYFHFFNDVIGKFLLAREHLDAQDIQTLIISKNLSEQPWFLAVQRLPMFHGMKWLIQKPKQTLVCRDLIVAKSPPHHIPYFERIVAEAHSLVQGRTSPYGRHLFLTRRTGVRNQRIPSNQDALEALLVRMGFTALDPAELSWEEQVLALRDCELLVGVHGAGMTNLIFRGREPMHVVEIFPPTKSPPHYYWLAMLFGHDYKPLVAPKDFEVDLDQVAKAVERCLGV